MEDNPKPPILDFFWAFVHIGKWMEGDLDLFLESMTPRDDYVSNDD